MDSQGRKARLWGGEWGGMKEEGTGQRRGSGADERTGSGARERVVGGVRDRGAYANRWLGEGARVESEMWEVTRGGGGEGRGVGEGEVGHEHGQRTGGRGSRGNSATDQEAGMGRKR